MLLYSQPIVRILQIFQVPRRFQAASHLRLSHPAPHTFLLAHSSSERGALRLTFPISLNVRLGTATFLDQLESLAEIIFWGKLSLRAAPNQVLWLFWQCYWLFKIGSLLFYDRLVVALIVVAACLNCVSVLILARLNVLFHLLLLSHCCINRFMLAGLASLINWHPNKASISHTSLFRATLNNGRWLSFVGSSKVKL